MIKKIYGLDIHLNKVLELCHLNIFVCINMWQVYSQNEAAVSFIPTDGQSEQQSSNI